MTKYSAGLGKLNGMRDLTATLTQEVGFSIILARDAGLRKQTIFVIALTEFRDAGSPALVLDPIHLLVTAKKFFYRVRAAQAFRITWAERVRLGYVTEMH